MSLKTAPDGRGKPSSSVLTLGPLVSWILKTVTSPRGISDGRKLPIEVTKACVSNSEIEIGTFWTSPQYWQDLDAPSFATDVLNGNTRAQIEALAAYIMSIGQ